MLGIALGATVAIDGKGSAGVVTPTLSSRSPQTKRTRLRLPGVSVDIGLDRIRGTGGLVVDRPRIGAGKVTAVKLDNRRARIAR
ncbi:MAG: hypothetical protein ACLS3Y_11950 [Collinsella sp.]